MLSNKICVICYSGYDLLRLGCSHVVLFWPTNTPNYAFNRIWLAQANCCLFLRCRRLLRAKWLERRCSSVWLAGTVCCLLSAVCCLLSAVCCLLSAICCLLSAVCCLLLALRCLLSAAADPCEQIGSYDVIVWLESISICKLIQIKHFCVAYSVSLLGCFVFSEYPFNRQVCAAAFARQSRGHGYSWEGGSR
jgi:hypothetical protein